MTHARILVIDADESCIEIIRDALIHSPCQVEGESNGFRAMVRMRDEPYDLVFLDPRMPGLNGVQTLDELKRLHPDTPVVIITSSDDDELLRAADSHGAATVLRKPLRLAAIREAAARWRPAEATSATDSVRWGILGSGMIADWIANAAADCELGAIVAVASRDGERAARFADQHGLDRGHGTYDDLLADVDIEGVIICLPNSLHREWTERVAAAGKHILCEKPLATSAVDVEAMFAACRQAGVVLMEAAMYRFQPQMDTIVDWVREGRIGQPRLLRGTFCFPFSDEQNIRLQPDLGGGCLFDLGFYPVDFAGLIADCDPDHISAAGEVGPHGVETVAAGIIHYPCGLTAQFQCGFAADTNTTAEIIGETGTLRIPDPWTARGTKKELVLLAGRKVQATVELPDPNSYTRELDHMSACVRGRAQPRVTREQSLRTARSLETARRQVLERVC